MENRSIKLQLLDTNGSDYYRRLLKTHFKTANGVIFIYDASDKYTFNNLYKWINDVNDFGNEQINICKILVANKIDSYKEVSEEQGKKFAQEHNMPFFEISVKENTNVEQIFTFLANKMLRYQINKLD